MKLRLFAGNGGRAVILAATLWLGFVAIAFGSIHLSRQAGGVATVWPVNAFLMAGLILLPRSWRPAFGVACAGGLVCANMIGNHDPFALALLFTGINVAESVVSAILFRSLCHGRLNTPARLVRFVVQCVAPVSFLSALAAAGVVANLFGGDFLRVLQQWFAATLLGTSVMLPSLLILAGQAHNDRISGRAAGEIVAGLAISAFFLAANSFPLRASGLILAIPALTLFAYQRGPKAAVTAALSLAALALPLVLTRAPVHTLTGQLSLDQRVWMIQIFIAAIFFTAVTTALAVQAQKRLSRLLTGRTRSAREARTAAEAASRAKTDFLATMSHEIRTPMNAIIGFTDVILRTGGLPEETRRQLHLVERASGALLTVVNDILDFSKVEAGQVELNLRAVSLRAVVEDSLAIVADAARRKGLALDLRIDGGDGLHLVDDHRLRQVLLNLLNNAIKFTESGAVTLRLTSAAGLQRFEIADTGVGIAPEGIARLFQRFSQADGSISRSHGGTGLGLAICKGLVQLMGGQIGVESTPGKGSTFWFELPLASADSERADEAQTEAAEIAAHILLVDDHPMNRELAVTILGLLGCTADTASDGYEATLRAQERAYDIILMDVHMPGMDGLAATRAIRAGGGLSAGAPIVAMSADVLPEQLARCREAGMVDSVGKPIDIQALHRVLSAWVGRDAAADEVCAA